MKKLLFTMITAFALTPFFTCNTTDKQNISEKLNRLDLLKNALEEQLEQASSQLKKDHPVADLLLSELPSTFFDHSDFLKTKALNEQIKQACERIIPGDKIEMLILALGCRYLHYFFSLKNPSQSPDDHSESSVRMITPYNLADTEQKHDLVYIEDNIIPYYQKYHNPTYPSDVWKQYENPEHIIIEEAAYALAIKNYLNALLEKTENKIQKLNAKI
jgi:hypothetical protein